MSMMNYDAITPDQIAALQAFAKAHGRKWKNTLSEIYWYNARIWRPTCDDDGRMGSILHGLRNSHGCDWLHGYKLPA